MTLERDQPKFVRTPWDDVVDRVFAQIDKAAEFMDEGCGPTEWPPSSLLKLTYCILATGPNASATTSREALELVTGLLDKARDLWIRGYVANPLADQPILRPRDG